MQNTKPTESVVPEIELLADIQPNTKASYLFCKRTYDIIVSALTLIILSPFFLIVAIVIKLDDPKGGIIYSQLRTGRYGKPFRCYKFRSMYADADERKKLLMQLNEMDGPVFKIKEDPRITKVGQFIRKTSIDELPQFYNVLRGDMSIVGPRPLIVSEASALSEHHRMRELIAPGLTCYWQISGRNKISFERWMELDLQYIQEQSFWVDLCIVIKTFAAVVHSEGAY